MSLESKQPDLSHIDPKGDARMVDVSPKEVTVRQAGASGVVRMRSEVLDALMQGALPKGDALATARVAGIQAAKRTSEWIPLCHPLALDWVQIEFDRTDPDQLVVRCMVKSSGRTGVEMEALTAVAATALTLYDMAKSADKGIVIGPICLDHKSGGKSGTYQRPQQTPQAESTTE